MIDPKNEAGGQAGTWEQDSGGAYFKPAPVAEAPERVTQDHRDAAKRLYHSLRGVPASVDSQTEIADRELVATFLSEMEWHQVSSIRKTLDIVSNSRDAYEREFPFLRTKLAESERKAEGLRVENEGLLEHIEGLVAQADDASRKLAESERKLGNMRALQQRLEKEGGERNGSQQIWTIAGDIDAVLCGRDRWQGPTDSPENRDEFARSGRDFDSAQQDSAPDVGPPAHAQPAAVATEPAGVEAGKAERTVRVVKRTRDEHPGIETDDPTQTETEAPVRFRVGQRVKWLPSGRIALIDEDRLNWVNSNAHQFELVEPSDPAPPKPGGERGEFINPQNASEAHARAVEALESGKVTQAVAWLCDAVRMLEREGGGKDAGA